LPKNAEDFALQTQMFCWQKNSATTTTTMTTQVSPKEVLESKAAVTVTGIFALKGIKVG
jgi:hypothetical protein